MYFRFCRFKECSNIFIKIHVVSLEEGIKGHPGKLLFGQFWELAQSL